MSQTLEGNVGQFRLFYESGKVQRKSPRFPLGAISAGNYPAILVSTKADQGRCSSCFARSRRRQSTTKLGNAIVRALRRVFGGLVRITPPTTSTERRTDNLASPKLMSCQHSPMISPRRKPVPITTTIATYKSDPSAALRSADTPLASSTAISRRSNRGGVTASNGLGTVSYTSHWNTQSGPISIGPE